MDFMKILSVLLLIILMNWSKFLHALFTIGTFLLGIFAVVYWYSRGEEINISKRKPCSISHKLSQYYAMERDKRKKLDKRISGSPAIDDVLNEIFARMEKDYIVSFYQHITSNDELLKSAVPEVIRTVAFNLSNRVKSTDWVQYLSVKLVVDITNHFRLYNQAKAKMSFMDNPKNKSLNSHGNTKSKNNSKRPSKSTSVTCHKRNKSETDIYRNKVSDDSRQIGNSVFFTSQYGKQSYTLDEHFFDLEFHMEDKLISREQACCNAAKEIDVLSEIGEILMYVLLPRKTYNCEHLRTLLVTMLVSNVLKPVLNLLSDPDFINQLIISMCSKDTGPLTDIFVSVIKSTEDVFELNATYELVLKQMQHLNSYESVSETAIRQQLSSLQYLARVLKARIASVTPTTVLSKETLSQINSHQNLPSGCNHSSILLLSAIDLWKMSAQKKIVTSQNKSKAMANAHEYMKSTALTLCNQYLSSTPLPSGISEKMVNILYSKIKNYNSKLDTLESPLTWFDEIQLKLSEILQKDQAFLNYLWDLPQDWNSSLKTNINQTQQLQYNYNNQNKKLTPHTHEDSLRRHSRSRSDITISSLHSDIPLVDPNLKLSIANESHNEDFHLSASIIETGVVQDKSQSYGVYAVEVTKTYSLGKQETWHIYRRYSDFHDLHTSINKIWPELSSLIFPGKKAFQNKSRTLLERRMIKLNDYLNVLKSLGAQGNPRYKALLGQCGPLADFFKQKGPADRSVSTTGKVIDAILVNPLKVSMQTLKSVPNHLANTVDEVMQGISKVFHRTKSNTHQESYFYDAVKVEKGNNPKMVTPARAILRLAEEIFGLKADHLWIRRRIVGILETLLSERANRKISHFFTAKTSKRSVLQHLNYLKEYLWPHNIMKDKSKLSQAERDIMTCARTRVAAKCSLLSSSPDEFKRLAGAETVRLGISTVFDILQRQTLNKRLIFVILEGIFGLLFPEHDHKALFQKLHTRKQKLNAES